jgi:hypothetical protein
MKTSETTRREQLKSVAESYFAGLARKDVSAVPWDENVALRTPLAPGGLDCPINGRAAVVQWFGGILPALSTVKILEHYFNEELTVAATRADVALQPPRACLRVVDRFTVSPEGKIVQQENHYDPRPAL